MHCHFLRTEIHLRSDFEENDPRRYFKPDVADPLDGQWLPAADAADQAFAGRKDVRPAKEVQTRTDNISHGELIRAGYDHRRLVDPNHLRFLFQGLRAQDQAGRGYGVFRWRIAMLTLLSGRTEDYSPASATAKICSQLRVIEWLRRLR